MIQTMISPETRKIVLLEISDPNTLLKLVDKGETVRPESLLIPSGHSIRNFGNLPSTRRNMKGSESSQSTGMDHRNRKEKRYFLCDEIFFQFSTEIVNR